MGLILALDYFLRKRRRSSLDPQIEWLFLMEEDEKEEIVFSIVLKFIYLSTSEVQNIFFWHSWSWMNSFSTADILTPYWFSSLLRAVWSLQEMSRQHLILARKGVSVVSYVSVLLCWDMWLNLVNSFCNPRILFSFCHLKYIMLI